MKSVIFCSLGTCWLPAANVLSATSQILWPLASTSCDSFQLQMASLWPLKYCGLWPQQTVTASSSKWPLCDISNIVAFDFNKLWWFLVANGISATSQILWPLALTNSGDFLLQMASLQLLKYSELWLQQTVVASSCKWPICDLSNIVAFGFNKLWLLLAANDLSATSQILWTLASTNFGGF